MNINDGVKLISFTVGGTRYQVEEGMTWGEFVESEYNINAYFWVELDGSIGVGGQLRYVGTEEDYVYSSHIIIEGYEYIIVM